MVDGVAAAELEVDTDAPKLRVGEGVSLPEIETELIGDEVEVLVPLSVVEPVPELVDDDVEVLVPLSVVVEEEEGVDEDVEVLVAVDEDDGVALTDPEGEPLLEALPLALTLLVGEGGGTCSRRGAEAPHA